MPVLLLARLTPLCLFSSSDSLSYLILDVPMHVFGKQSCMSCSFPIATLNGTCLFPTVQLQLHKENPVRYVKNTNGLVNLYYYTKLNPITTANLLSHVCIIQLIIIKRERATKTIPIIIYTDVCCAEWRSMLAEVSVLVLCLLLITEMFGSPDGVCNVNILNSSPSVLDLRIVKFLYI